MDRNVNRASTSRLARRLALAAILVTLAATAACTGGVGGDDAALDVDPSSSTAPATDESGSASTETLDEPAGENEPTEQSRSVVEGTDGLAVLPERPGPREETTHAVPHVQLDAVVDPELDAELERRAYSLPGLERRESTVSLPGARSLWLADDIELTRPEVLQAGREFAHIHPNGSLHVWLPVDRAIEVAEMKWGELHPWVGRDDFWDGLVMIYTPETPEELDVVMRLVVDAYNYVTGAEIDPETVA